MSDPEREQLERLIHEQHRMLVAQDRALADGIGFLKAIPLYQAIMFLSGMLWGGFLMRALLGGFG